MAARDIQSTLNSDHDDNQVESNQKLSAFNQSNTYNQKQSVQSTNSVEKMLVNKYFGNPIFDVLTGQEPSWRSSHAANSSIIPAWQVGDGKWKMYMRGSGWKNGQMHDQIGLFTQHWSTFKPFGPWESDPRNPILKNGPKPSYDSRHLLDTVAIKAKDDIYLYYKSRDMNYKMSYSGAYSKDKGQNFTKFPNNPFSSKGPSDVVYHNGHYYHYTGHFRDNKLQVEVSKSSSPSSIGKSLGIALSVGAKGSYDQQSVFGSKVFRVTGDPRWFMVYQLDSKHVDYPERIHVAYSKDLIKWTKVVNKLPFMMRGQPGEWDQGGLWTSDIFEYKDILYFYYEGWGSYNNDTSKRDTAYYKGGNSRLGGASVSVSKFLDWVKGDAAPYNSIFKLVNVRSGKTMDVAGRNTANGTNIHQWDFWDGSNQKFEFVKEFDGSFKISPLHSNSCLDIAGGSTRLSANLHLWSCHGGANQDWFVEHVKDDEFLLRNKKSKHVLEVAKPYGKGANVQQNHYNGGSNQRWRLIEISN
jgi:hypothetical protein